jgi:WD40 repeat protein
MADDQFSWQDRQPGDGHRASPEANSYPAAHDEHSPPPPHFIPRSVRPAAAERYDPLAEPVPHSSSAEPVPHDPLAEHISHAPAESVPHDATSRHEIIEELADALRHAAGPAQSGPLTPPVPVPQPYAERPSAMAFPARVQPAGNPLQQWLRTPLGAAASGGAAVALLAGVLMAMMSGSRQNPEHELAVKQQSEASKKLREANDKTKAAEKRAVDSDARLRNMQKQLQEADAKLRALDEQAKGTAEAEKARQANEKAQAIETRIRDAEQKARDAQTRADAAEKRVQQLASAASVRTAQKPDPRPAVLPTQTAVAQPIALTPTRWQDSDSPLQERRLYASQIKLAKQAWDRGETGLVQQILEPYQRDSNRQQLRNFAWYYLWSHARAATMQPVRPAGTPLWSINRSQDYELLTGMPPLGWINGLAFAPASDRLIGAGCGENSEAFLGLWNLGDLAHPQPFQAKVRAGMALGFSPDSRLLAVGEGTIRDPVAASRLRVWDLTTGRVTATLPGLAGFVSTATYSPDGRLLAATSGDLDERIPGRIQLWDTTTGKPHPPLPDLYGRIDAAFSPDGRVLVTLASSHRRPATLFVWNPDTGALLARMDATRELTEVTAMAVSPDGRLLVTGHGDLANPLAPRRARIRLWDLARRQFLAELPAAHQAAITCLAFTRRGTLLASGDQTGMIHTWDIAQRQLLHVQIAVKGPPIRGLAFDWYGVRLVSAAQERCLRVWDVDSARALARLDLSAGNPTAIRFSPDGASLVAVTDAGGLTLWDSGYRLRGVLQGEASPTGTSGHSGEILAAAVTASGKRVITTGADRTMKIWDLATGEFQTTMCTFRQPATCMAICPVAKKVVVGTGRYKNDYQSGELILCQTAPGDALPKLQSLAQGLAPTDLAFTPDGNTLAVCALTGNGQSLSLLSLAGGPGRVLPSNRPQAVAISPDGRLMAVGCAGGDIELWSLATGDMKPQTVRAHDAAVTTLAFSPDGTTLASGASDNNVKIWDVASGEELLVFKHDGPVQTVRFSPDGKALAVADRAAGRGTVRLWRAQ